ncbi:hypothetical protein TNCT_67171 [Trichonephila clavata]|uniref:Uncharacterized protein n=1 Tax=Trichonephila clavata TaxID=2740835 RepID=A0A8X6LXG4_TRICU|nr:hypothetical protein TNCT_67171 [Trichonephila clavata]
MTAEDLYQSLIAPNFNQEAPLPGYFCEGYVSAFGFATPSPLSFCVDSPHFVATQWNRGVKHASSIEDHDTAPLERMCPSSSSVSYGCV